MNWGVIFSSARSGGNLLDGLINKYQNGRALGEIYGRSYQIQLNERINNKSVNEYTKDIEAKYQNRYDIIIPRFHQIHLRFGFNVGIFDTVFDNFDKKIILYRENLLNKQVSFSMVMNTKTWHYSSPNEVLPDYKKYQIYLNKNYMEYLFINLRNYYNGIIERYGGDSLFFVKYEDIVESHSITELADWLGLIGYNASVKIPTRHINPTDDGYKQIINYEELKHLKLELKKTKYGYRF